jgi:tetratricopeptide (TPR) repeat protein
LINEGKTEKAEKVLDRIVELTPHDKVPYDYFMVGISEAYYRLQKYDKGNDILNKLLDITIAREDYFLSMDRKYIEGNTEEIGTNFQIIAQIGQVAMRNNQSEISEKAQTYLETNSSRF